MPATGTIAVRVAATGRRVFQDVIAPADNATVGGILDVLESREVDYNGEDQCMYVNGSPATRETAVQNGDNLILVPDKPTGN